MKKNFLILFLSLSTIIAIACSLSKHVPYCSLDDVNFIIKPHIKVSNNEYFLEYQVAILDDKIEQKLQVGSFINNDKAYYYFIGKTSFREMGNIVQKSLSDDKLSEFAKVESVYWLNADKSEVRLSVSK